MGLCKCRTVTTLFCFEHRKNICEKCITTDHSTCIVKSYLQWLQDSEYETQCTICNKSLNSNSNDKNTNNLPPTINSPSFTDTNNFNSTTTFSSNFTFDHSTVHGGNIGNDENGASTTISNEINNQSGYKNPANFAINDKLVRLTCLDLFHLKCLNNLYDSNSLSSSTSSSSSNNRMELWKLKCPICQSNIIPPMTMQTPIAKSLRTTLLDSDWKNILLESTEFVQSLKIPSSPTAVSLDHHNQRMVAIEIGTRPSFLDLRMEDKSYSHSLLNDGSNNSLNGIGSSNNNNFLSSSSPFKTVNGSNRGDLKWKEGNFKSYLKVLWNFITLRNVRIMSRGVSPRHLLIVLLLALVGSWSCYSLYNQFLI